MMLLGTIGSRLGMLVVETIAKIRRAYFQDGKPINRSAGSCAYHGTRFGGSSGRARRSSPTSVVVQPQPRIGPWRDELDRILAENARKPKRERLTHIRIFEELRALAYEGGYDARAALCGDVGAGRSAKHLRRPTCP